MALSLLTETYYWLWVLQLTSLRFLTIKYIETEKTSDGGKHRLRHK